MKIKPLKTSDLCKLLNLTFKGKNLIINGFNNIEKLKKNQIGFSNKLIKKKCVLITNINNRSSNQTIIISKNPRFDFCRAIQLFKKKKLIIKKELINKISKSADVKGIIDGFNISIGNNTVIEKNAVIKSNVRIGNNCIIRSGAIIGGDGFGFAKDKNKIVRFDHWGGVEIKNNVEIGYNSCVDCGALSDTIIETNTKLDNHVHIGHNVIIGKNNLLAAHTQIAGSVKIGNNCFFSPSTTVASKIKISDNCFVGIGSVVARDLKKKARVFGNPAKELKLFKK